MRCGAANLVAACVVASAVAVAQPAATPAPVPQTQLPIESAPALVQPATSPRQGDSSRRLTIPRVSRPPKLDDFLNGTPRDPAARVNDFRRREPGDGQPATRETSAYLSYDDK